MPTPRSRTDIIIYMAIVFVGETTACTHVVANVVKSDRAPVLSGVPHAPLLDHCYLRCTLSISQKIFTRNWECLLVTVFVVVKSKIMNTR